MKISTWQSFVFRFPLSLALFVAAFFRYNIISLAYLVALLCVPLLPLKYRPVLIFLVLLCVYSAAVTITHIIVQILAVVSSTSTIFEPCTDISKILLQVGFLSFKNLFFYQICRVFCIDPAIFAISLTVLLVYRHLESKASDNNVILGVFDSIHEQEEQDHPIDHMSSPDNRSRRTSRLNSAHNLPPPPQSVQAAAASATVVNPLGVSHVSLTSGASGALQRVRTAMRRVTKPITDVNKQLWRTYFVNIGLTVLTVGCCYSAGIMSPSLLSFVYFLLALLEVFAWSYYGRLISQRFFYISSFVIIFSGLHVLLYYLYQFPVAQVEIEPSSLSSRLLGMYVFIKTQCDQPGSIVIQEGRWFDFVAPALTLALYFLAAMEVRRRWNMFARAAARESESQDVQDAMRVSRSSTTTLSYQRTGGGRSGGGNVTVGGSSRITGNVENQRLLSSPEAIRHINYRSMENPHERSLSPTNNTSLSTEQPFIVDLMIAAMQHSYILSFVAMLGWSVLYVSWMTFALLFTGCLLMCLPNTRKAFLYVSPLLVLYGVSMMIMQYIYCLNLTDNELPDTKRLQEIGLKHATMPVVTLSVQFAFLCTFLLTLRLFLSSRGVGNMWNVNIELDALAYQQGQTNNNIGVGGDRGDGGEPSNTTNVMPISHDNQWFKYIGSVMRIVCYKYWIILCCAMFLAISLQLPPVLIRIVYMLMLMYFLFIFMVSYSFWRSQMIVFWWIVIIYSMLALCFIYTFQFEELRYVLVNSTGLPTDLLDDIGLEEFKTAELLSRLLTPVTFIILVVFQTHYFHQKFLDYTNLNNADSSAPDTLFTPELTRAGHCSSSLYAFIKHPVVRIFGSALNYSIHFIWRVLEIHCHKLVALMAMLLAIYEPCAAHFILVFAIAIFLPYRNVQYVLSGLLFLWVGICLLINMVFKLKSVKKDSLINNHCHFTVKWDDLAWSGISPIIDLNYIILKGSVVALTAFHHAVDYHRRAVKNVFGPAVRDILFSDVLKITKNDSISNIIKYHINYLFCHLGLEMCFIVTVICASLRLDVVGLAYILSMLPFLFISRSTCRKFWPFYCTWLSLLLMVQYAVCVGLPPGLCISYNLPFEIKKLKEWLFLPDYESPPKSQKLILDFIQFLFICCQNNVFQTMQRDEDIDSIDVNCMPDNLDEDFVTHKKTIIDHVKHATCYWFYWVVLGYLFVYAVFYTNIHGFGYLLISFVFLWMGHGLMLRRRRALLRLWNIVVVWVVIVICFKIGLQIPGCIFTTYLECPVATLLGSSCLNPIGWIVAQPIFPKDCSFREDSVSTMIFSFILVILQRKIFKTKSFSYVVLDLMVKNKFSSRGAYLINKRLMIETQAQNRLNDLLLQRIRNKVEQIRRRQEEKGSGLPTYHEHYMVLRSGDWAMFEGSPLDEDNDVEFDEIITPAFPKNIPSSPSNAAAGPRGSCLIDDTNNGTKVTQPIEGDGGDERSTLNITFRQRSPSAFNPIRLFSQAFESGPITLAQDMRKELYNGLNSPLSNQGIVKGSQPSIAADAPGLTLSGDQHENGEMDLKHRRQPPSSSAFDDNAMVSSPATSKKLDLIIEGRSEDRDTSPESGRSYASSPAQLDDEDEEDEEDDLIGQEKTCCGKCFAWLTIGYMYILVLIDYLIVFMKRHTIEYRGVRNALTHEQMLVKERLLCNYASESRLDICADKARLDAIVMEIMRNREGIVSGGVDDSSNTKLPQQKDNLSIQLLEDSHHIHEHNRLFHLISYLFSIIGMYSVNICYFIMIANHLFNGSVLSLAYPLLVFLWGMFSVPRPGKKFWITIITYTEFVILLKYVSQFKFYHKFTNNDFYNIYRRYVLGAEKNIPNDNFNVYWDVLQLIIVFMHRSYLKNNGLWHDRLVLTDDSVSLNRSPPSSSPIDNDRDDDELIQVTTTMADDQVGRELKDQIQVTLADEEEEEGGRGGGNEGTSSSFQRRNETFEENILQSSGSSRVNLVPKEKDKNQNHKNSCWNPLGTFRRFFARLTNRKFNRTVDLYVYMFLFEFLSFVVIILGYSDFSVDASQENALNFIQQNKVPIPFLFMLIVQFVFIVVDRSLFLKKNVYGKFIFQIIHVIIIHLWLFFLLPYVSNKHSVTDSKAVMFLYIFKCLYFTVSAFQVKSGYPHRILGNFLTRRCGYLNLILFKVYMIIPFLYELRSLMDWMWTETTLSLSHWMTVEDIMAKIFVQRCWRLAENNYPVEKGRPYIFGYKLLSAGLLVLFIFICLWGPLALASLINVTATYNPPVECTMTITLGSFPALFSYTALRSNINEDPNFKNCLNDEEKRNISKFGDEDIYAVQLDGSSGQIWGITPPGMNKLIEALQNNNSKVNLNYEFSCRRSPQKITQNAALVVNQRGKGRDLTTEDRANFLKVLENANNQSANYVNASLDLPNILPSLYYLKLLSMESFTFSTKGNRSYPVTMSLSLTLQRSNSAMWWEISEIMNVMNVTNDNECPTVGNFVEKRNNTVRVITLNERILEGYLGSLFMKFGIIGLYAAYLLVVHRLLRSLYDGLAYNICYNELPFVDRIFYLCHDIYLVRESQLFYVEEAMVARLFFIYRSHETLIKWTRPSQDLVNKFTQPPEYWRLGSKKND